MAKKKITGKKAPIVNKKKSKKSPVKKESNSNKKSSKISKPVGKKRGRKASSPNRYNTIRSAISEHFRDVVGRKVKRYEIHAIYEWIKANYANQAVKYMVMNIDSIIDRFYKEYCNLFPVDIDKHARFFEWYNFKNYMKDEEKLHYPSDIISVDLSVIDQGLFDFSFNEYPSKSEVLYQTIVEAGLKRTSPAPSFFLKQAYCDIDRRCNVFEYILTLDEDNAPFSASIDSVASEDMPVSHGLPPIAPTTAPQQPTLSSEQVNLELEKEKIKQEYQLKQAKMKEFSELLKSKAITFQEYLEALKSLN